MNIEGNVIVIVAVKMVLKVTVVKMASYVVEVAVKGLGTHVECLRAL